MSALLPGTVVLARGRRWHVESRVPHLDCAAIRLASADGGRSRHRTLLVPFDRIEPLTSRRAASVVPPRRWARQVLWAVATAHPFGSLAGAAAARLEILPFQLEPALAVRRHGRARILIADDVGLGKTIQAGLLLAELAREQHDLRAIVLAPAGLRDQWRQELGERFALDVVVTDAAWLSGTLRRVPPDVNPWGLPGVYVTSMDMAKRPEVLRPLEDVTWDVAIVDEAHACTRHTARRAAIHAVASRARRVVLLTATPPDGDPGELLALRSIGELRGDPPLAEFRRRHVDIRADAVPRRSSLHHVRLSAGERRMHRLLDRYTALVWTEAGARADQRARLATLVLRKRALSSPWSLRASLQRRLQLLAAPAVENGPSQLALPLLDEDTIEDDAPDAILGAAGLVDAVRERALLVRLERAATHACRTDSKLRFLLRLIRRAREPVIIFTEYRDTLQHLERRLAAAGYTPLVMHGGLGPRERIDAQRHFNDSGDVLLATDAASEGLNLHRRCRSVVHFELPWTLARLRQRTGRVDRLGQRRRVHEILLVARHTAERVVLAPLVRRALSAREGGSGADRLVEMLTESTVAAAVMDGQPVCVSAPAPGANVTMDLREEARYEADRIAAERRLMNRNQRPPVERQRFLICRCPSRNAPVDLLVAVTLEDVDGRVLHASLVSVAIDCALRGRLLTSRERRALADELVTTHRPDWQRLVLERTRIDIDLATARHRLVSEAFSARDDAMLDERTSAARQLVQAGLFDTRAIHALDRQRRAAALLSEEHRVRARQSAQTDLRTVITPLAIR